MRMGFDVSIHDVVEALFKVPNPAVVSISRDGRWLLFTSEEPGINQIYSARLDTAEVIQLTNNADAVLHGVISNSGKTVAFLRDVGGNEAHRIFELPIEGGKEESILSEESYRIGGLDWSSNDSKIAFAGSTNDTNGLWIVEIGQDTATLAFRSKGWCSDPRWVPGKEQLGITADTTGRPRSQELVFLRESREPAVYTPKVGSYNVGTVWSRGGRRLLFMTDFRGRYELAVLDVEARTVEVLRGAPEVGNEFPVFDWSEDERSVNFVASKGGYSGIYREALDGGLEKLAPPIGSITSCSMAHGRFAAISWSSLDKPEAVGFLDLVGGRLTTVYDATKFLPEWIKGRMAEPQEISYRTSDGKEINGFMVLPREAAEPHPCVIAAHGGPWIHYNNTWKPSWQALATCGYVVIGPNYRGSTGYGPEFQFAILGDAGGVDLKDVIDCRNWAEHLTFVDPKRIAILGGSYGGYLVNIAMTKFPDRWAAGVSYASFTDWKEDYELADASFKVYDELYMGGTPELKPDLYRDRSAYHFTANLKDPLLLLHPENDSRCPLRPVKRFYDRLKELGKDVQLKTYKESGHVAMRVEQEIETYVESISFLNEKLEHGLPRPRIS
jgi:dipeptidyl aminopeptidase/acylaminoacyl peptidase